MPALPPLRCVYPLQGSPYKLCGGGLSHTIKNAFFGLPQPNASAQSATPVCDRLGAALSVEVKAVVDAGSCMAAVKKAAGTQPLGSPFLVAIPQHSVLLLS